MKIRIGYIIASNRVAKEGRRVGYLYREEPDDVNDSGWRVFSGDESQEYTDNAGNFAMYNAATILEVDPSIGSLLDAPPPAAYERTASGEFIAVQAPEQE